MRRLFRFFNFFGRSAALTAALACLLSGGAAEAQGTLVMAAYQRPYAMNFEIWQPAGLPSGWYATFDGFPVAQVAENRWVYGRLGMDGALVPTDVLVGSVVPGDVPGLTRIAAAWGQGFNKYFNNAEFRKILNYRCNRMGYLNDPAMRTAVAWNTGRPGVWVWLGDRWKKISPRQGEYTWQALVRYRPWISEELRRNNVWWYGAEPVELADLARQWGLLWNGSFALERLGTYSDQNDNDNMTSYESREDNGTPNEPGGNKETDGDWHVDENENDWG